jgi:hypothetical protein
MDTNKINNFLTLCIKNVASRGNQEAFKIGICYCQLGDFHKARENFEKSCMSMFVSPMLWHLTSQPNWLIDICILSGKTNLLNDVYHELKLYRSDKRGDSLVALYSYEIVDLIQPNLEKIYENPIDELLKRESIKDMYFIGLSLQALREKDSSNFKDMVDTLLEIHHRKVLYGGLRDAAEGLVCMSAMSLVYAAKLAGMKINFENQYLPVKYLDYLYGNI